MRSPASGTLTVEIASSSGLGVAVFSGPVGFLQPMERRISLLVSAGAEVIIDVSAAWNIPAAARFTLSTALAP